MIRALTTPAVLLRIEAGALLALSLLLYWKIGGNWLLFAVLLLAPDISAVGYLVNARVGAAAYNLFHIALLPSALAAAGVLGGNKTILALALIWFSHINMDRALGYGLKLTTGFTDTHLGRIGKRIA